MSSPNWENETDENLIQQIRRGQQMSSGAFDVFYHRWASQVHRRVLNLIQNEDDAKETTQDVFVSFYETVVRGGVARENPGHYLMRTATNRSLNYIRNQRVEQKFINTEIRAARSTESGEDSILVKIEVSKALNILKPKQKVLLVQRYYEGKSPADIGRETGRSKRLINYRLAKIRKILEKYFRDIGFLSEGF